VNGTTTNNSPIELLSMENDIIIGEKETRAANEKAKQEKKEQDQDISFYQSMLDSKRFTLRDVRVQN